MSSEDIESMREALAALARTPSLLASFGIERLTVRADLWHERLAIQGLGKATLSTLRSIGDASGEEIGRYETSLGNEQVGELLKAVELTLEGGPPPRLSPGDVRVVVTVVACGARWLRVIGGLPPALAPYRPLLFALDKAAFATRQQAKSTLKLVLGLPETLPPGEQTLTTELAFENRGSEGAWMRSPSSGIADQPAEHVRLWYARAPVEQPGVTPLPPEPTWVPLEPMPRVQRPLLWLAPGEHEARQFVAQVSLDPGRYLMRASFSSYEGEDTVGGQPLLRGCAFSDEHTVEVGK